MVKVTVECSHSTSYCLEPQKKKKMRAVLLSEKSTFSWKTSNIRGRKMSKISHFHQKTRFKSSRKITILKLKDEVIKSIK